MIFTVQFEDNPGFEHQRDKYMQEHLRFLEAHAICLAAGPLFTIDGQGQGGMWLIEADDVSSVEDMIRKDPFHETGLRKSITILEWRQVMRNGKRLI